MPISSRKLGPGTLTIGAGPLDVSAQVIGCKVTPSEQVDSTDDLKVLTHEVLAGDETVTFDYVLEGSFLQDDPGASSVVDYSWAHAGEAVAVVFTPNTVAGREVSGTVSMVPLSIGGDEADTRMTADFSWRFTADPTLS